MDRFAQIACWEQAVTPVGAVHEQDVDIAMKLAMLKPVVKQVEGGAARV
jgi:hypothetical protein